MLDNALIIVKAQQSSIGKVSSVLDSEPVPADPLPMMGSESLRIEYVNQKYRIIVRVRIKAPVSSIESRVKVAV